MARTAETAMYKAMHLHQNATDEIIQENTKAIGQMSAKVGRAISNFVMGVRKQRESINRMVEQQSKFLELATLQAQTIGEQGAANRAAQLSQIL